jgi:hypothetical protein
VAGLGHWKLRVDYGCGRPAFLAVLGVKD